MTDVDKAVSDLREAKNQNAIGEEFARDYIIFHGVKVYCKTVSHAWVIPSVYSRLKGIGEFERGMLAFYLLSMDAETVRNRGMQELSDGTLLSAAIGFLSSTGSSRRTWRASITRP